MFRAIKIVGTIVSFLVGSIGTLHRMDKQGQVDPVAVEEESTQMVRNIFEKLLKMAGFRSRFLPKAMPPGKDVPGHIVSKPAMFAASILGKRRLRKQTYKSLTALIYS